MREIARRKDLTVRPQDDAKEAEGLAKYADDWMKRELIEERAGEIFSEYTLGPHFIDFCRGPHVPSTEKLKAFKLLSIAGAYWKGDEKNPQLQRIYGTAFFYQEGTGRISEPAGRSQEARPSQARPGAGPVQHPGTRGPGIDFFPSQGRRIRKIIEDWMREQYLERGYSLVYTPHVMRRDLWKTSGHCEFLLAKTCSSPWSWTMPNIS